MFGEVPLELGDERRRHRHLPPAGPALGVVLDHFARGQPEPLPPDGNHCVGEVDVVPPQGEQLALSEPGQPGGQDEGPVAVRDCSGELSELGHGGEALLGMALDTAAINPAGVLDYAVIVDCGGEDLTETGVRLCRHRPASSIDEGGVPMADQLRREVGEGDLAESGHVRIDAWQDVESKLSLVDLPGPFGDAGLAPKPAPGVVGERRPSGLRIDPLTPGLIGLDLGQPPGRFGLAREGAGRGDAPTTDHLVPRLPSSRRQLADASELATSRHPEPLPPWAGEARPSQRAGDAEVILRGGYVSQ